MAKIVRVDLTLLLVALTSAASALFLNLHSITNLSSPPGTPPYTFNFVAQILGAATALSVVSLVGSINLIAIVRLLRRT